MVVTEITATVIVYQKQHILGQALSAYMGQAMQETEANYGSDLYDTQLWDEIQMEVKLYISSC